MIGIKNISGKNAIIHMSYGVNAFVFFIGVTYQRKALISFRFLGFSGLVLVTM